MKNYRLSNNLINSLIATDLKKMNTNYIKLPCQNIYFSISNKYFEIYDPQTGNHKVYGAFITENDDDQGLRHWRLLLVAEENENSTHEILNILCKSVKRSVIEPATKGL